MSNISLPDDDWEDEFPATIPFPQKPSNLREEVSQLRAQAVEKEKEAQTHLYHAKNAVDHAEWKLKQEQGLVSAYDFMQHLLDEGGEQALEEFRTKVIRAFKEERLSYVSLKYLLRSLSSSEKNNLRQSFPAIEEVDHQRLMGRVKFLATVTLGALLMWDGRNRSKEALWRDQSIGTIEQILGGSAVLLGIGGVIFNEQHPAKDGERTQALSVLAQVIRELGNTMRRDLDLPPPPRTPA